MLFRSKALTTIQLCFIKDVSTCKLIRVDNGMTFIEETLSINTFANVQYFIFVVMSRAFVFLHPFGGISSSLNEIKLPS